MPKKGRFEKSGRKYNTVREAKHSFLWTFYPFPPWKSMQKKGRCHVVSESFLMPRIFGDFIVSLKNLSLIYLFVGLPTWICKNHSLYKCPRLRWIHRLGGPQPQLGRKKNDEKNNWISEKIRGKPIKILKKIFLPASNVDFLRLNVFFWNFRRNPYLDKRDQGSSPRLYLYELSLFVVW